MMRVLTLSILQKPNKTHQQSACIHYMMMRSRLVRVCTSACVTWGQKMYLTFILGMFISVIFPYIYILHLVIWQTLLSEATYNWGIHKAIHLEEAIFNLFLTVNRRSLTGY